MDTAQAGVSHWSPICWIYMDPIQASSVTTNEKRLRLESDPSFCFFHETFRREEISLPQQRSCDMILDTQRRGRHENLAKIYLRRKDSCLWTVQVERRGQ